jgi:alkylhydroperoxidase family enzyme
MAMKKSDSSLTPSELIAVEFARKLTRDPSSVTDADYGKLRSEFGDRAALDVIFQTSAFAFMNRFADAFEVTSEDIAVQTYRQVYGADRK